VRVLALDYGSARCGAAVCDPTETIVTPIEPIVAAATRAGLAAIAALVADREVALVVVGLPLSLRGTDSAQTAETRAFAQRLARRLGDRVPIELHDERLTTRLAQRDPSRRASEDSRAAAHLLEHWLAGRAAAADPAVAAPPAPGTPPLRGAGGGLQGAGGGRLVAAEE
jgi:putative Holliday junction resolvase